MPQEIELTRSEVSVLRRLDARRQESPNDPYLHLDRVDDLLETVAGLKNRGLIAAEARSDASNKAPRWRITDDGVTALVNWNSGAS